MRKPVGGVLGKVLDFKPGTAFWVVGGLLIFFGGAFFVQYETSGSMNVKSMFNRGEEWKYFWEQNPSLQYSDSYPNTTLLLAQDRQSGRKAMLDMFVVNTSKVQVLPCESVPALGTGALYRGAADSVCLAIHKPDPERGIPFSYGASYTVQAKDADVSQFYRKWFTGRGTKVDVVQDSSRAVILEAEGGQRDTLARVAIRGSFGTARVFLAITSEMP